MCHTCIDCKHFLLQMLSKKEKYINIWGPILIYIKYKKKENISIVLIGNKNRNWNIISNTKRNRTEQSKKQSQSKQIQTNKANANTKIKITNGSFSGKHIKKRNILRVATTKTLRKQ